jgi:hypothetical protein
MVSASAFSFSVDETVEESDVLQPAAIVMLEQIAQDRTSGLLVRIDSEILRTYQTRVLCSR